MAVQTFYFGVATNVTVAKCARILDIFPGSVWAGGGDWLVVGLVSTHQFVL